MALNDLTTVARCMQYILSSTQSMDSATQAKLQVFITRLSAAALGDMGRDTLLVTPYSDVLDGTGTRAMMLARWPVIGVSSLVVGNCTITPNANPPCGPGYQVDKWRGIPPGEPSRLVLSGYYFTRGLSNVFVSYTAGYGVSGEAQAIPDDPGPYTITPNQPYGLISADNGVTYANGTALTPVTASPAQGQYVPPHPLPTGPNDTNPITSSYTFNANDANAGVLLSYSYIPDAVEGAVCQWVAEQWAYKDRVGTRSKSLGGQETVAFIVNEIPAYVKLAIQPYRNIVPLQ